MSAFQIWCRLIHYSRMQCLVLKCKCANCKCTSSVILGERHRRSKLPTTLVPTGIICITDYLGAFLHYHPSSGDSFQRQHEKCWVINFITILNCLSNHWNYLLIWMSNVFWCYSWFNWYIHLLAHHFQFRLLIQGKVCDRVPLWI